MLLAETATLMSKRSGDPVEMLRLLKMVKDAVVRSWALNQLRSRLVAVKVTLRERLRGLSCSELITRHLVHSSGIGIDG